MSSGDFSHQAKEWSDLRTVPGVYTGPMLVLWVALMLAQGTVSPPPDTRNSEKRSVIKVPFAITVEGGGALPVPGDGRIPNVQLVPVAGGKNLETPLTSKDLAISVGSATDEYRVRVENLPDRYRVKSMTFGDTDLVKDTLKASIQELSAGRIITYSGQGELQRVIDSITARQKMLSITVTAIPLETNK